MSPGRAGALAGDESAAQKPAATEAATAIAQELPACSKGPDSSTSKAAQAVMIIGMMEKASARVINYSRELRKPLKASTTEVRKSTKRKSF